MRNCIRITVALACTLVLPGCFESFKGGINPPPAPTSQEISQSYTDFQGVWNTIKTSVAQEGQTGNLDDLTAQRFVAAGYDITKRGCDDFFRKNRNLRNETGLAKDTLVSASAATGFIAGLSGAAINVLTGFLGATGIIPGVLNNFDKSFLISDIADSIYSPIMTGMVNYRAANPPDSATRLNALDRVTEHARICTVSSMLDLAKKSIGNTTIKAEPDTTGGDKGDKGAPGAPAPKSPAPAASTSSSVKTIGRNGAFVLQSIQ
jgi:hypothetical protein